MTNQIHSISLWGSFLESCKSRDSYHFSQNHDNDRDLVFYLHNKYIDEYEWARVNLLHINISTVSNISVKNLPFCSWTAEVFCAMYNFLYCFLAKYILIPEKL